MVFLKLGVPLFTIGFPIEEFSPLWTITWGPAFSGNSNMGHMATYQRD